MLHFRGRCSQLNFQWLHLRLPSQRNYWSHCFSWDVAITSWHLAEFWPQRKLIIIKTIKNLEHSNLRFPASSLQFIFQSVAPGENIYSSFQSLRIWLLTKDLRLSTIWKRFFRGFFCSISIETKLTSKQNAHLEMSGQWIFDRETRERGFNNRPPIENTEEFDRKTDSAKQDIN